MKITRFVIAVGAIAFLAGCTQSLPENQLDFDVVDLGSSATESSISKPGGETETNEPESEPGQEYAVDKNAEIDIEDQLGDGKIVAIEEIRVGRSSAFLVIYNQEGLVLGKSLVSPQSQPVNIKLQIPLVASAQLEAVLYLDNGDGSLNLSEDLPLVDNEGELVHEDFSYQVTSDE